MKNLLKKAHELTKEIKREFPEINYKAQLGICIKFLSEAVTPSKIEAEISKVAAYEEAHDCTYTKVKANEWIKAGKNGIMYKRIYFNLQGYNRKGKLKVDITFGYFDLNTNTYVTDKKTSPDVFEYTQRRGIA